MNIGVLLLPLAVGLTLSAHGSQKLFGWFGGRGLNSTGQFFEERLGFRLVGGMLCSPAWPKPEAVFCWRLGCSRPLGRLPRSL